MLRGFRASRAISMDIPISVKKFLEQETPLKTSPRDPTVDSCQASPPLPPSAFLPTFPQLKPGWEDGAGEQRFSSACFIIRQQLLVPRGSSPARLSPSWLGDSAGSHRGLQGLGQVNQQPALPAG